MTTTIYTTHEAMRARRVIAAAGAAKHDARWATLPTSVSRWLDAQCRRRLHREADEVMTFDPHHAAHGRTLVVERDLAAVTSVTIGGVVLPSTEFVLEPHVAPFHHVTLRRKSTRSWGETDDEDGIAVIGRWCMLPENDDRLALLNEAALQLALFAVDNGDAGAFQTIVIPEGGMRKIPPGFPKMVLQMIEQWRRLPY